MMIVLVNLFDQYIISKLIEIKFLIISILLRFNIANCRDRRVVIVESVITPTRIRHLLADILLKQFEVC
jgi:hypothetical protein